MRWPFKKTIENNLIRSFETGLRMVQVSLFTRLHRQYSATMPEEAAKVMAAQVVNYLKGEDLLAVMENSPEPLRAQIAGLRQQVPERAAGAMLESASTREVIVGTLRMREVLEFMLHGEAYLHSDRSRRNWEILSTYGPEFPEEIKPEKYLAMSHRYMKEQLPNVNERAVK
jgi:hypothetical protein